MHTAISSVGSLDQEDTQRAALTVIAGAYRTWHARQDAAAVDSTMAVGIRAVNTIATHRGACVAPQKAWKHQDGHFDSRFDIAVQIADDGRRFVQQVALLRHKGFVRLAAEGLEEPLLRAARGKLAGAELLPEP